MRRENKVIDREQKENDYDLVNIFGNLNKCMYCGYCVTMNVEEDITRIVTKSTKYKGKALTRLDVILEDFSDEDEEVVAGEEVTLKSIFQEVKQSKRVEKEVVTHNDVSHIKWHKSFDRLRGIYGKTHILDYNTLLQAERDKTKLRMGLLQTSLVHEVNSIIDLVNEYNKHIQVIELYIRAIANIKEIPLEIQQTIKEYSLEEKELEDMLEDVNVVLSKVINKFTNIYLQYSTLVEYILKEMVLLQDTFQISEVLKELNTYVDKGSNLIQKISTKQTQTKAKIDMLIAIEYTRSWMLWDFRKIHPSFELYSKLLWNTPKFQQTMKLYLPKDIYILYIEENRGNRELILSSFEDVPYYYNGIKTSENCKKCKKSCKTSTMEKASVCKGCEVQDLSKKEKRLKI